MIKLKNIIEISNTSLGKTVLVDMVENPMLHVGEMIDTPAGVFKIIGIQMPSKPTTKQLVWLIVE